MECPHCGKTLPFILCPECKGETPEKSNYCAWCGRSVIKEEAEIDLSERIMCSDGNCIGVVNEEGVCNICKKPYAGEPI